MAFKVVQEFNFKNVEYSYDTERDVLYISFGHPVPAIALQIEDWLALRIGLDPPVMVGMTIVGFKNVFEKVNRYIEKELPERMKRFSKVSVNVSYDDQTDTLIMRSMDRSKSQRASIFEELAGNLYIEKALPSKDFIGVKILEFTKQGLAALEQLFGTIVDTLLEPGAPAGENAHLITNAIIRHLDRDKLASFAA